MARFVLVPGAWLGGWVWERVVARLTKSGHIADALTLPGLGDRATELAPSVGLMAHVWDVVRYCRDREVQDAFLVGHSYAGAVVGAVARRMPRAFRGTIFVDTMPLAEGAGLLDGASPESRHRFDSQLVDLHGTRVWPVPEPLGAQAPTEGLSHDDLELLRRRSTPHPARSFREPLSGLVEAPPYPPNHGISCVEDDSAAVKERAWFLQQYPDWTYHALPICHWPMLATPERLADVLEQIAAG